MNYYGTASLIMDGAAVFILVGMLIYTSLYRRRGTFADKVFFALILADIIAAVSDGIVSVSDVFGISLGSALHPVIYSVFFLAIDAFSFLFCVYQMYRMKWEKGRIGKTVPVLCIPELILVIMLFVCVFTGNLYNLYTGVITLGNISVSAYYFLSIAPMIICGVFTVCVSFKQSRQILIPISLLIIVHICLTVASVSNVTPLFLSIYLMFAHLLIMRDSFYGEAVG